MIARQMTGNGLIAQGARYGLVGLVVLAADFGVYSLLLALFPGQFLAANLCGKLTGAALGFVLHRHVTFRWAQRDGAAPSPSRPAGRTAQPAHPRQAWAPPPPPWARFARRRHTHSCRSIWNRANNFA